MIVLLSGFNAQGQSDSTSAPTVEFKEKEFEFGWAINLKYKYSLLKFDYKTDRTLVNNKLRLRFTYDGYRITNFVLPEYGRILFQADLVLPLKSKGGYRHRLLPKAGFAVVYDLYDGGSPMRGFSTNPNIGMDYQGYYKKFQFTVNNSISIFTDGFWYEINPSVAYNFGKSWFVKANMNTILAKTFNGNSGVGTYPGLGLFCFLQTR